MMDEQIKIIGKASGVNLKDLPLNTDFQFTREIGNLIQSLPQKNLKILVISNPVFRYQEKALLLFFNNLKINKCDWYFAEHEERSFNRTLDNINYLDTINVNNPKNKEYDYVVSFDCYKHLLEFSSIFKSNLIFFGTLRPSEPIKVAFDQSALPGKIKIYYSQISCIEESMFNHIFGENNSKFTAGIDFPPNVDLHYATPEETYFKYVMPGGGDRDYKFIYKNKSIFDDKVYLTHSDNIVLNIQEACYKDIITEQNKYLELIRADKKFVPIKRIHETLYLKMILYSKIIIMPVLGHAIGDYTSIADALWYGKPVLTNKVRANSHLDDRVIFFEGPDDLSQKIKQLEDADYYNEICIKIRQAALEKNNIYSLLTKMYLDM